MNKRCVLCTGFRRDDFKFSVSTLSKQVASKSRYLKYRPATIREFICDECWKTHRIGERIDAWDTKEEDLKKRRQARYQPPQSLSIKPTVTKPVEEIDPDKEWDELQPWFWFEGDATANLLWFQQTVLSLRNGEPHEERLKYLTRMPFHEFLNTPYWLAVRAWLLDITSACASCGSENNLDVHAECMYRPTWNVFSTANLRVVCASCASPWNWWQRLTLDRSRPGSFRAPPAALPGQRELF